ncbi:MAG: GDP-mannose 4,6-dehydratase [Acidobacteriota bacterium]|nr:GDP-mannose 4,6-dehydratase [Acidobacteriota bacterium]
MATALITGIAGQDGSYLAEWLLARGWDVHGTVHAPPRNLWRLEGLTDRLRLHPLDLEDAEAVHGLVASVWPDACWHLTGIRTPSPDPASEIRQCAGNVRTTQLLLQALQAQRPEARFVFAASSEIFGTSAPAPQSEVTPPAPETLYAIAKTAGLHLVQHYRRDRGLKACAAILFNHESPRRGEEFVTRKITLAAARIRMGLQSELRLGDLQAMRDWGHARSYAQAMGAMGLMDAPEDLVLATGVLHTLEAFVSAAFAALDLDWRQYVREDPSIPRPSRGGVLRGDPSRAWTVLGWRDPVPFESLARDMAEADLARLQSLANERQA